MASAPGPLFFLGAASPCIVLLGPMAGADMIATSDPHSSVSDPVSFQDQEMKDTRPELKWGNLRDGRPLVESPLFMEVQQSTTKIKYTQK